MMLSNKAASQITLESGPIFIPSTVIFCVIFCCWAHVNLIDGKHPQIYVSVKIIFSLYKKVMGELIKLCASLSPFYRVGKIMV